MSGQLVKKYLNETSLHGFGYADDKNKFFVAFWSLLTAACVAMAVRDISNLIQFAQTDPTAFTFEVKSGDNQPLPTPTLCMEILVIPPKNITIADVETDIQTFIKAQTISNITAATTTNTDNDGNRVMTNTLEYVTYMMLGYMTDSELQPIGLNNQLLTDFATRYIAKPADIANLTKAAFDAYRRHNFSLSDLKRLVGVSLCKKQYGADTYFTRKMYQLQQQQHHHICEPATLTHLSFSLVCSKLFTTNRYVRNNSTSQIRFTNIRAASPTYYSSASLIPERFGPKCKNDTTASGDIQLFPAFLWHLDLQGRPYLPPAPASDIINFDPALATTRFELSITTEYQFYNRKLSPCLPQTGEVQHECQRRNIVERLSQACKCWPSSFIDIAKPTAMPNCNDLSSLDITNISLNCSAIDLNVDDVGCPKDCLRYSFDIDPVESYSARSVSMYYVTNHDAAGRAQINFPLDSLRSVITESTSMSFTIFACSFGGWIGTWLGGSLLAFIHIPIFFIANLTGGMAKRKKVEDINKEQKEINNVPKDVIYPPIQLA